MSSILIVDDEASIRFPLRSFLEDRGFAVREADTLESAERTVREARPDAVILDYVLPDGNALDVLPRLKDFDPSLPVIVLTGHASVDLAVRAVKEGADHFLAKPVDLPALHVVLMRALEQERDSRKKAAVRPRQGREAPNPFLGTSLIIRELAEQARKVAGSPRPIVILGETGTGKGVLARWLHRNGPRSEEAFVEINCASLSREFLESEMFGHEKGSFTGAVTAKQGLLEVAHRGVAFLDEIGDMDQQVQPRLLKVLEEKRFRRLGEVRDRQVDVQLIAATHQDIAELVRQQRFRSDLYFRISGVPLRVPALRERPEDIPLLARALLEDCAAELGRRGLHLTPDAEKGLEAYSWPGNVRELRNVLERAALLTSGNTLHLSDLHFELAPTAIRAPQTPTDEDWLTLAEVERRHIVRILEKCSGKVPDAARRLGVPRSTLYDRLKQLGLSRVAEG